jgi:hypothetical protein
VVGGARLRCLRRRASLITDMRRFEGTCDVCGADIALDHDPSQGIIDIGYDVETSGEWHIYTWMRHYATAPPGANPDCAVYSSRVDEVHVSGAEL